ncbi:MAG: glycyl-radical enzyme activating protein [Firmicutes bacterium]|nr:glycyl-radical enzyme activating protein [Bacillota bacterium]
MRRGVVFNVERYAVHDGPGIRTVIFLKGCLLRCKWCSNPEGQEIKPELCFEPADCIGCGRCAAVCPNAGNEVRSDACLQCTDFECAQVCLTGARKKVGRVVTAGEIVQEVLRDLPFYKRSGGGVTLSGGDPLFQVEFAAEILNMCKERDIGTCIETSGVSVHPEWRQVVELADFVFLDMKHIVSNLCEEATGSGNDMVFEVARALSDLAKPTVVRVPLVTGYNDSEENMAATARAARSIQSLVRVEILPYHRLGVAKYRRFGKVYTLDHVEPPAPETVARLREVVVAAGVECRIV